MSWAHCHLSVGLWVTTMASADLSVKELSLCPRLRPLKLMWKLLLSQTKEPSKCLGLFNLFCLFSHQVVIQSWYLDLYHSSYPASKLHLANSCELGNSEILKMCAHKGLSYNFLKRSKYFPAFLWLLTCAQRACPVLVLSYFLDN